MSFNTIYEQVPLGSLAKFINGDRGENYPKPTDYVASGIPFVSATDIDGGYIAWKQSKKISPASFASLRGGRVQHGDILFCLRGSLGKLGYVAEEIEGAIASSLVILRAESLSFSRYLRFVLCSTQVQEAIKSLDNGSVQGNISAAALKNLLIPLPPTEARLAITSALEAIEGLIDLNRRINQTLEAMAQAIFKSWFVDFDPVKAKIAAKAEGSDPLRAAMSAISGKTDAELDAIPPEQYAQLAATAAPFPDELVASELGAIPKGWICSSFSEIAQLVMGQSPDGETYNDEGEGTPLINGPVEFGSDFPKRLKWTTQPTKTSQRGDLIVCVRGSTTGKFVTSDGVYCLGRGVCAMRAHQAGWQPFVDYTYKFSLDKLLTLATGSTFPSWSGPTLKNFRVIVPTPEAIDVFSRLISPSLSSITAHAMQIESLSALRDALLPRLLSGELMIQNVEAEAGA